MIRSNAAPSRRLHSCNSLLLIASLSTAVMQGCEPRSPSRSGPLADKTVQVAPGGGGAEIQFDASRGQTIRVTMSSPTPSVQPYGHLQGPEGEGLYVPKNETAKPGANSGETTLRASGRHTLTVFDGSNNGGSVSVKVEAR